MEAILTLDRIEEDRAIFLTEKHQLVILPTELLPAEILPGQTLAVTIGPNSAPQINSEQAAKDVLNELLSTD
ncbi:hypothetical protein HGA64_00370 [Candidatus Falkowbacteria bacterium]|nr:hypothetical protein [Candidatus Falkowbacteria bacterium]